MVCMSTRLPADELLDKPEVVDMFAAVLRHGKYGMRDVESAAFVFEKKDGTYQCVAWPESARYHAARFKGEIPRGVVAIVHTHPVSFPAPSKQDRQTAKRLGIPIYAVTMGNVYKADTSGREVRVMRGRQWNPRLLSRSKSDRCPYRSKSTDKPARPVAVLDLVDSGGQHIGIAPER
jgi:proteasome lid subunit RPN8/RPN11